MSASRAESAIRQFTFDFPEAELEELRSRIRATRWPDKESVDDQTQGTPLATIQALARYWASDYDWRKCEARLKAVPHFITTIDGLDIHFVHVRSKHEDALPMIVTHGWPGSVIEQLKIVGPLTDPTAYGGSASEAFHLVIPSMPGYGFSGKPTAPGWDPVRMARAWAELMQRLGYTRYVAQGGDWGAQVTELMGELAPPGLIGIHTNMPGTVPADINARLMKGEPLPSGLSDEERRACEQLAFFYGKHLAYALMMGTRPQTLTGLADSPIGLAAFLIDHDDASLQLISETFAGERRGLSKDDVLDNITFFWLTNTAISAARLYWENKGPFFGRKDISLPVAMSIFPDELYQAPRSWAEQAYPNLIHYNRLDRGGHFAAWEQPELFVRELREGFRSLREMSEPATPYMPSFDQAPADTHA